ncbi:type 1 glutamine amidotransferase [Vibrio rarus]|uniref:type 1 glutamine amidotransferase n=1 Tax=Vibrio rarus TaxID=413403 RepID=UPI0021C2E5F8|nr:type 1 glutamine amidotransferase [Vibrio rarus]
MKIGILICGYLDAEFSTANRSYSTLICSALHSVNRDIRFFEYDAYNQHLPQLDECDGYIIIGSLANAYDNAPWIIDLMQWTLRCEARRKPQVGIGFGHQLIARALGGTVERSPKGWGLGNHEVNVVTQKRWMNLSIDRLRMLIIHQDQVVTVPKGMRVIASSDFCANFMLAKDNHLLTVQGHPELTPQVMKEQIERRKSQLSEAHYRSIVQQSSQVLDSATVLYWMDAFFTFNTESIQDTNVQNAV